MSTLGLSTCGPEFEPCKHKTYFGGDCPLRACENITIARSSWLGGRALHCEFVIAINSTAGQKKKTFKSRLIVIFMGIERDEKKRKETSKADH